MKIELFTYTYNDEDFLPFFLDYYEPIVDKMTFIDSGSTDNTLEIIYDHGHNIIETGLTWWDWDRLHEMKKSVWKGSEYDLIFFPDLDEIFYRPNLKQWLEQNRFPIYQMEGFQMVSRSFPKKGSNILEINKGAPFSLYNKFTIFSPKADIEFPNAHVIGETKDRVDRFNIKCLHYKFIGIDSLMKRARTIIDRVPPGSYCHHIKGNILTVMTKMVRSREEYLEEIAEWEGKAKVVI